MLPDLESLRCFEAAAAEPSFRAAAARVALSPAAFSDRIKRLEELLGVRLFERTTRRIALTPAGRRLLPEATRTLAQAAACLTAARDADRREAFELRLGTRFELGMSWLVPALGALEARRPERALHLFFGDSPDLLNRVKRGTLDAAITSARLSTADWSHERLHEEDYVFCGAPDALQQPVVAPEDAARHTLFDLHTDLPLFRYFADARPAEEVWAFAAVRQLGTIAAVRHRTLEGAGLAVLPRYFVAPDLAAGRLQVLLPDTALRTDWFRLVWRQGHPHDAELRRLSGALRSVALR
jgi:LysR family transcriptional regulator, glycine cleavage system transcriptional activator